MKPCVLVFGDSEEDVGKQQQILERAGIYVISAIIDNKVISLLEKNCID